MDAYKYLTPSYINLNACIYLFKCIIKPNVNVPCGSRLAIASCRKRQRVLSLQRLPLIQIYSYIYPFKQLFYVLSLVRTIMQT